MTARMSRGTAAVLARMLPEGERAGYVETMAPVRRGARVAAGHVARDNGARWEAWLAEQHRRAAARGLAYVRKVGAPVVVGRGGLPVEWAGTGPADFQGVLRGGRALAVEAKSVETRLSLRDVAEHQQRDLDRVVSLGGLALLAVEIREAQVVCVVPWTCVPWRERERTVRRRGVEVVERSRSVGAPELTEWTAGECYLARFVEGGT